MYSMRGHTSTVRCVKMVDGRPICVTGSRDMTVRVWDLENGRALRTLTGHSQSVRCLEVAGNKAVSGSYDYTCKVGLFLFSHVWICTDDSSGMSILGNVYTLFKDIITKSTRWLSTE